MSDYSEADAQADHETGLAVRPDGEIVTAPIAVTPAQAKTDAIAALTMQAYAKASELKLTPEEDKALAADFPNEAFRPGANGNETLIYIEHAFLRDRMNDVLGRGQWSLVVRSKWTENYTTSKGGPAVRVYSEVMLMVRGCFVAEATGEMDYYPNNAKTTYADAIEGSKTAAFRRLAKDFGIGLQAWKKDFSAAWWEWKRKGPSTPQQAPAAETPEAKQAAYVANLVKTSEAVAKQGLAAYQLYWEKTLTKNQRGWLKDDAQRLKAMALAAGAPKGDANEDEYQGDQEQ